MGQSILLRGAKQLLTLRGPSGVRRGSALQDLGIIEDGSVLIQDGVITQVGTSRRIENLKEAQGALEIAANGRVIMPAFIDANLDLNIQDWAAAPDSLLRRKTLAKFYEESLGLARACLQYGTLTAEVKASAGAGNIHADISVIKQLAKLGNNPIDLIRTWRITETIAEPDGMSDDFYQILTQFIKKRQIAYAELDSHWANTPALEPLLSAMSAASVGVKLLWRSGVPDRLAGILRRMHPATVCCPSHLQPAELSALSSASSISIFSPGKEISESITPGSAARELVDSGAPIALSTGFHFRRSPSCSMQMALFFAVLHLRLTIEEAITAATINAAHAIGLGHLTGSIEAGKRADLLLLTLPDYREIPRQYGMNHVGLAIREGNIVFNRTRWKIGA